MANSNLLLGIDIGSTTAKIVLLENEQIIYSKYERHYSKVREKSAEMLAEIKGVIGDRSFKTAISGSAGMGFGWRAGSGAFSGAAFRAGTCTGEASAADKYDGSSTKTETGFAAGRMV